MQKVSIVLVVFFLVVACFKDNDDEIFIESPVIGNWKHFETLDDIITQEEEENGGNQWQRVENGRSMSLNDNGTFSRITPDCASGFYVLDSDTIAYECDNPEDSENVISYNFEDEFLILNFGFVSEKFRKILPVDN